MEETKRSADVIISRLESSLLSIEQASFDAINITDRLVSLLDEGRRTALLLSSEDEEERELAVEQTKDVLNRLLDTAFTVNNVAHDLEREAAYQRETTESVKQIIDFMYIMDEI